MKRMMMTAKKARSHKAKAAPPPPVVTVETLLDTGTTVLGDAIRYPVVAEAGSPSPHITVSLIRIPPGTALAAHSHAVPLVFHILTGSLTVDYGCRGERVYTAGDTNVESMDWAHAGRNDDAHEEVTLLAMYVGATGVPLSEAATLVEEC
jgi:quercetin dioxygenase-like cupin family protein